MTDSLSSLVSDIRNWMKAEQSSVEADLESGTELLARAYQALEPLVTEARLQGGESGLSKLAAETVAALRKRIGVDVAFVYLLRTTDGTLGVSLDPGVLPVDTAGMQVLEGLHVVRTDFVNALAEAQGADKPR